eukprot:2938390-Rhodomonas_salina.1
MSNWGEWVAQLERIWGRTWQSSPPMFLTSWPCIRGRSTNESAKSVVVKLDIVEQRSFRCACVRVGEQVLSSSPSEGSLDG